VAQSVTHNFEPRAVHEGFVVVSVALGQFLRRVATSVSPLHHFQLPMRLVGPGIECRLWRDFLHLSRPALGPIQLLV
jgi:hypothetical protein